MTTNCEKVSSIRCIGRKVSISNHLKISHEHLSAILMIFCVNFCFLNLLFFVLNLILSDLPTLLNKSLTSGNTKIILLQLF